MAFPCNFDYISGSEGFIVASNPRQSSVFNGPDDNFRVARALGWAYDGTTAWTEWKDNGVNGGMWAYPNGRKIMGSFSFAFDQRFPQHAEVRFSEGECYLLIFVARQNIAVVGAQAVLDPVMAVFSPALITRVGYVCDIREGAVVEGSADFVTSGDPRIDNITGVDADTGLGSLLTSIGIVSGGVAGRLIPYTAADIGGDVKSIDLPQEPI